VETPEVIKMLTWINSFDGRVQLNEPNVTVWAYAMRNADSQHAKSAVLEHSRLYGTAPKPNEIAARARQLKASEPAKQRALAIAANPPQPSENLSLRERDPELWEQLIEQGRQEAAKAKKERAA
jgi:hypothetical protein